MFTFNNKKSVYKYQIEICWQEPDASYLILMSVYYFPDISNTQSSNWTGQLP